MSNMHPIPTPETIKPMGLDLPPAQLPEFNHLRNYAAVTGSFLAVTGALASANSVHAEDTPVPLPTEQTVAPLPTPPTELTPITPPVPTQVTPQPSVNSPNPQRTVNPELSQSKPRIRATKFRKTSKNCGIAALRLSSQPGYPAMRKVEFNFNYFASIPKSPWERTEARLMKFNRVDQQGIKVPIKVCKNEQNIRLWISVVSENSSRYSDKFVKFHPKRNQWVALSLSRLV